MTANSYSVFDLRRCLLGDIQEDHYPIVSAPTPFLIGLPDMESIAEHTEHGGTAQVCFLEVPPTHGTRAFGRFIDAEDLQDDKPIRAMVRTASRKSCSCVEGALEAKPAFNCN
jgi:hypothetical protein|eukprot:COSAG02_NODE_16452_length_1082_cov_0.731434_2_plen_113_part_00